MTTTTLKFLRVIGLVAIASAAWSTAAAAQTTPLATVRGAFIGVSVGDLDGSVKWYSEKLGLSVIMRPPKIEKSTAVILQGGGLTVELMNHDDAVPLRTAAPSISRNFMVHGIFKAGIFVAGVVWAGILYTSPPGNSGPSAATIRALAERARSTAPSEEAPLTSTFQA